MPLLRVKGLTVSFKGRSRLTTVSGPLDFEVERGRIVGIVGESGCGKSVSAMALGGLLPEETAHVDGEVWLKNSDGSESDLLSLSEKEMRSVRGKRIGYIFQEPGICLNPVMGIRQQLAEVREQHGLRCTENDLIERLCEVGIPDPKRRLDTYPHELSGGMQQRIMIAMALAADPELLIADEPTTALDVTVQAQILNLIGRLRETRNMSVLLITHNFGLVGELAEKVMVMYAGEIVERGQTSKIIASARHPYTQALLRAVPRRNSSGHPLPTISGRVPPPGEWKRGCRFLERCDQREARCADENLKQCIHLTEENHE